MSAYRGNRRAVAGMAFLAFISFCVAISPQPGDSPATRVWVSGIGAVGCVASCVTVAWILSIRLELTAEGLSYRSIFGSREMRWGDIEYAWFSVVTYSLHGVPLGTRRAATLAPRAERRFVLGNSIARTEAMMGEVASLTLPHLYAWMIAALNTGQVLDLGAARLSRLTGLEMKGLLGYASIGLDEIERYEVDGDFAVWKKGAKLARRVRADEVANVYALRAVLDTLFKPPVSRGAALYAGYADPG